MQSKKIFSKYGLIGENLDLKQNVELDIDKNGIIIDLSYDNIIGDINPFSASQIFLVIPGLINSHVHIGDSFAKEMGFNKNLIEIVAPPNGLKHKLLKNISREITPCL